MRTEEQVQQEIEALKEVKDKIPKRSAFGDNNHRAIEVQITVLERRMTSSRVYQVYDPDDDYIFTNALDAVDWLEERGGWLESTSLAEDWRELIRYD